MIYFYSKLVSAYNWTLKEIDEQDLEDVLCMLAVANKAENAPELAYIEDVLPL